MVRRLSIVLLSLLLVSVAPAADSETISQEELATGVSVTLRPHDARFDDANSGWIESEAGVVIVDAPSDPATVDALIARAREEGKRVRYLINTHWHGDHTEGNARWRDAFGDSLTILGHTSLSEDVPQRAATAHAERADRLKEQIPAARKALDQGLGLSGQKLDEAQQERQLAAIEGGEEWLRLHGDSRFVAPDLTYHDTLELDLRSRRIELHPVRAHTRGDTVVWLPQERIAFTGDMLDELPFAGHGYPRSWLAALDELAALDAKTFVPGHGRPFGPEHLQLIRGFLSDVVAGVDAARAAGQTLEQATESIDLSSWREKLAHDEAAERFFDGTVGEAIEAAWNELP